MSDTNNNSPNENSAVMVLTFDKSTLELSIAAPDMSLDFAISQLQRALRLLESQEKLLLAHQARTMQAENEYNRQRTENVLSKLKM